MLIAIATYKYHIANQFDSATELSLFLFNDQKEVKRELINFSTSDLSKRISILKSLNINIVVCGAIDDFTYNALTCEGIKVYPWVCAKLDEVSFFLSSYFERKKSNCKDDLIAVSSNGKTLDSDVCKLFEKNIVIQIIDLKTMKSKSINTKFYKQNNENSISIVKQIIKSEAGLILTKKCCPNSKGLLNLAGIKLLAGVNGKVIEAINNYNL